MTDKRLPLRGSYSVMTCTLLGVEALPVTVEVDIGPGLPGIDIVGMADMAVQEARQRVRSALRACGYRIPDAHIVINLAPAQLHKSGTGFDLPIAIALLCATGQIDASWVSDALLVGELSLAGALRSVAGLLAYAFTARELGRNLVSAPASELSGDLGVTCLALDSLSTLGAPPMFHQHPEAQPDQSRESLDFADIVGQDAAKRALQIAAAGSHGILLVGSPGAGKTMLARRLPTILPPLSREEILQTALIHSVAGHDAASLFAGIRPFRSPHHSASRAGLVGGGNPIMPGEVSLSHNGVLYLDEMSEFSPSVLQALRQPLEDGEIVIVRAGARVRFPARFMLAGSSNPCPCGYFGDVSHECKCSESQVSRYQSRIGGPLMDRIDLIVYVVGTAPEAVLETGNGTSSDVLRDGVMAAREFVARRKGRGGGGAVQEDARGEGTGNVSGMKDRLAIDECRLSDKDMHLFEELARRSNLSARGMIRTLKVARTIADLDGCENVTSDHLLESLAYRDRSGR